MASVIFSYRHFEQNEKSFSLPIHRSLYVIRKIGNSVIPYHGIERMHSKDPSTTLGMTIRERKPSQV